ncbi:glycosyltransferase [Geofilum rubicundum]|uniref:Glycosyl transferase group 1 n=1 Tax=Geofilum rubicundum JCM 15548 TaxID=1236989 RepID=A0A0E9LSN5_9BACT|nr:glycosyltransferase [Geofilum rubicundum]GAO28269.1 glycosyl transferase group 1 [Geofilum rubicundum JCM 15548]
MLEFGILHINMANTWRGGERQVALLMENLKGKGVGQLLICMKNSALQSYCEENDLAFKSFSNIGLFLFVPFLIALWHLKKKYAIVHCHESRGHTVAFLARFIFRSSIKTVVHRRVIFPIKQKRITLLKYSSRYADEIICISKAVEQVVKKSVPDSRTTVIPSGVPFHIEKGEGFNFREKYNIPSENKIVAYVAALSFEKDHFTFLDSAKLVLDKLEKVHFVIIGNGSLYNDLLAYSSRLGISDKVTFTGFLNHVNQIINQLDLLLFTSKSEGLGSTILDFFVHQRPVVSAKNGGAEELIEDGKTGFLCDIGDAACFASKVAELLRNEEAAERMAQNAFLFAKENFTVEMVTQRIFDRYNLLVLRP